MNIIFNQLYRIDHSTQSLENLLDLQANSNLRSYILSLLETITEKESDKVFEFVSDTVEFYTLLNKIIIDNEYDLSCNRIANKLLEAEIIGQQKIDRLNKEIQKGILIISLVQMTETERKIIISKADYDDFLDDLGNIRTGLPLKKKIYKAFTANIRNDNTIYRISTYDTNATVSGYWWKEFLDLKSLRNDDDNTKNAFNAIESKILQPIKQKSKTDYVILRNMTIGHFRNHLEFSMDEFIPIYRDYQPYSQEINMSVYSNKLRELSVKCKFDNRFNIVRSLITSKIKTIIPLSDTIDLTLKQEVDMDQIFEVKVRPDDSKWVYIKSTEGYNYLKGILRNNEI